MKTFIIFLASLLGVGLAAVRYDNYTLYRIIPKDVEDVNILKALHTSTTGEYDFWTEPRSVGAPVDVLVAPERKYYLQQVITGNNMDSVILQENIQETIDEESKTNKLNSLQDDDDTLTWNAYHGVEKITNWLHKLAKENPETVTLLEGGRSYENRTIYGVKISFGPGNERRGVWLDSLIHAREWIAGATNTFILNEILHSHDPNVRRVAESHDWYFFPVINPDGYHVSHTSNRLWRKNTRPTGICTGIDLNRNWDYKWNLDGQASWRCQDTYAGTGPFSEIESKSLSNFISSIGDKLVVFLTIHSYSQLFLIPYGDSAEHVENYDVTYPVALEAARSLATRYGTHYTVGNTVEVLYQAYGGSDDWAKAANHIPFVYTFELRDTGRYGFLLPPEEIIPSGLETLDAVITLLQEAEKHY